MLLSLLARILARPRVTDWLIRRALRTPYTHIGATDGGGDYMRRFWLFNPYPGDSSGAKNWFPISIRIHHIRRPDQDRHLHDHPWNARTFILRGGYKEIRPDTHPATQPATRPDAGPATYEGMLTNGGRMFARVAGNTVALKFGEYHRITDVSPDGVWTLFVTGKYRGTWGFLVDGAKVQWRKYLGVSESELQEYRVWPDGTAQEAHEAPHSHMSDDYRIVLAKDEHAAGLLGNPPAAPKSLLELAE